ncbi:shikimate kinase AroL [Martelella alba]|uniref:Shikimate kinase n=1 Tax=Martelella alba TaxID=2590451 RepID=A0ABY2SLK8_9HYPH|nr:shikimate kinase AroL [Martelella alba]TKI06486.1 shikimate kinase AroL [Martelella alba]
MINTLILVGPRASGKTTVGKRLAARLRLEFIDTDDWVQEKTCKTIAQIVNDDGWNTFRTIESQVLHEVARPDRVIATGGGMVLSQDNCRHMKNKGLVFYLMTSAATVIARLHANPAVSQRPSLTGLSITDEITGIIASRDPLYRQAAHYVIDANNDKEQVAQDIHTLYLDALKRKAGDIFFR